MPFVSLTVGKNAGQMSEIMKMEVARRVVWLPYARVCPSVILVYNEPRYNRQITGYVWSLPHLSTVGLSSPKFSSFKLTRLAFDTKSEAITKQNYKVVIM